MSQATYLLAINCVAGHTGDPTKTRVRLFAPNANDYTCDRLDLNNTWGGTQLIVRTTGDSAVYGTDPYLLYPDFYTNFPDYNPANTNTDLLTFTQAEDLIMGEETVSGIESIFLILYWACIFGAWCAGVHKGGQR